MSGPYIVLERNQASGRYEKAADTEVCNSIDEALDVLDYVSEHTKALGRKETYRIFELVETDWVDGWAEGLDE